MMNIVMQAVGILGLGGIFYGVGAAIFFEIISRIR